MTDPSMTDPAMTDPAMIQANDPVLVAVTVAGAATVNEGESTAYTATAVYSDATTADVTATAEWSVDGPASIAGATLTAELVDGDTPATVTATFGGLEGDAALTVLDLALAEILAIDGTAAWPGTVVRAGAATYVDGSGALVEVPANTARITPAGILIEPAGTNLVAFSEDLTGDCWTLAIPGFGEAVNILSDATPGPMAGVSMDGVAADAANGLHAFLLSSGLEISAAASFQGVFKTGTQDVHAFGQVWTIGGAPVGAPCLLVDLSDGSVVAAADLFGGGLSLDGYDVESLDNGTYRVRIWSSAPGAGYQAQPLVVLNSGAAFAGDGTTPQLYATALDAKSLGYPDSYVRTAGAAATRPIDSYPYPTPAAVSTALAEAWTIVVKARLGVALADLPAGYHSLLSTQDQPNSAMYLVTDGLGGAALIARFDLYKYAAVTLPALAAGTDFLLCVAGEVGGNIVAGYRISGGDWVDGTPEACTAKTVDTGTLYAVHTPLVPVTIGAITVVGGALDAAARNAGFDL